MNRAFFFLPDWPDQPSRFFIWLVILWLSFFAEPLNGGATLLNRAPNVSVRMSTSIVESANYQPTAAVSAVEQATLPLARNDEISTRQQQNFLASRQQQYQQFTPSSSLTAQQRGPRSKNQDEIASRDDNSPAQAHSSFNLAQPAAAAAAAVNQMEPIKHFSPLTPINFNGKILDPGGHRWSISTSRSISPPGVQIISSDYGSTSRQAAFLADKTPSEHRHEPKGLMRRILDANHQTLFDLRCEGRGIGRMLKSAKNTLQEGLSSMEEHSGLLMLGSSILAATIPLAVLYGNLPNGFDLSNRRASGLPSADQNPSSLIKLLSLQSRVDSFMGWIERSVEHLPSFPRLHPQECVKRSICEAHNEPGKYGAVGFALRLFFPATNLSITDRMDNMEYKVINKYRHAAGFGLNKRIDSNGTNTSACKEKYEDCLISLLDVTQNIMNIFLN